MQVKQLYATTVLKILVPSSCSQSLVSSMSQELLSLFRGLVRWSLQQGKPLESILLTFWGMTVSPRGVQWCKKGTCGDGDGRITEARQVQHDPTDPDRPWPGGQPRLQRPRREWGTGAALVDMSSAGNGLLVWMEIQMSWNLNRSVNCSIR